MAKRKKRGNGEGSIYRKADGRWVTQYTAETAQGTKRKTLYGKTRREVAEKLRATLSEKDAGSFAEYDSKITVEEYLESYLADIEGRVRPKTFRRYQDLFNCHLLPALGDGRLRTLAPEHLRDLYRDRLEARREDPTHGAFGTRAISDTSDAAASDSVILLTDDEIYDKLQVT